MYIFQKKLMENGFYEKGEERRQAERENVTQAKVKEKMSKGKEREITDGEESKKKEKEKKVLMMIKKK